MVTGGKYLHTLLEVWEKNESYTELLPTPVSKRCVLSSFNVFLTPSYFFGVLPVGSTTVLMVIRRQLAGQKETTNECF